MTQARVSVILPVFNGEQFLAQSLNAILEQDYPSLEIIVADDGSTDSTPEVVQRYPTVRYVRQENAGPSAARNAGIAISTGDYVTFCDCDDLYHPGKVSAQVRHLEANAECGCVMVRHHTVIEPGTEPPPWIEKDDGGVQVQSAMVPRQVIDNVGGYNPEYRMSENMEWLGRIKTAGFGIDVIDEILVERRLHGSNASYSRRGLQTGLLASLRSRIEANRRAEQIPR